MNDKPSSNKALLGFSLLLAVVGLVAGTFYAKSLLHPPPPTATKPPLTVHIGTFSTAIDYSPFIVAKSKGWIEDALQPLKAKPQYETFQTLPAINESLAGKRLDFVFEAEPPAVVAKAAGIDVRIIALSCTVNLQAVVPASSPITNVAQLSGKRVAVLSGSGAHYGLMRASKQAGIKDGDLKPIDMVPPDAKAAFASGQLDAWMIWPPWPEQEVAENRARFLPGTETPIHSLLVARSDFFRENPEVATNLVNCIDRAKTWIIQNPAEAQKIVATELGLSPKVVELAWPRHDWGARFSDAVMADIQGKGEFLVQLNFIKRTVDIQKELLAPLGTSK